MAKVKKSDLIMGLERIGAILKVDAETQSVIDCTVADFKENPRNVTTEELKEVIGTVETNMGKSLKTLLDDVSFKVQAESQPEKVEEVKEEKKAKVKPTAKENSEKKSKIKAKKTEPEAEVVAEVQPEAVAEVKKEEKPKEVKQKLNTVEFLAMFPRELKSKSVDGTLVLRDDIKDIAQFMECYNKEQDLVIATFWSKRHLKQYADSYDPMGINPNRPKSFENDLDLIEVTFVHQLCVTGNSLYSMVPSVFKPEHFEMDEEGIRYANGLEFQIYEVK